MSTRRSLLALSLSIATVTACICPAEAQSLPFEVCTAASGDPVGVRCVQSIAVRGRQRVEVQIPANSFHTISVKPLMRRDVSIELKCLFRRAGGGDEPAVVGDGGSCPSTGADSSHIKTIALSLAGPGARNAILGYRCWTSKLNDPTKSAQPGRIWFGPASEPCGVVAENQWISGIEIYTFGYPEFP